MLHKRKVKGKWQYFENDLRISEYEYILKTEAEILPLEIIDIQETVEEQ